MDINPTGDIQQKNYETLDPDNGRVPVHLGTIVSISFLAQLAAHFLLKEYMLSVALGGAGFLIISFLLSYVLLYRKDIFAFILIIYICSHFSYADNQGGLWNLMSFGLLALFLLFIRHHDLLKATNLFIMILLVFFVSMDVVGTLVNSPLPWIFRLEGLVAFFGFIFMFQIVRKVEITPKRCRQFLIITLMMLIYQIIVSLNQRYAFINWNTPLIGAYGAGHGVITYGTTNAKGTFRNSELFGEYAVLLFTLLMPLISSFTTQCELKVSAKKITLMIICCLICILLTSTRAAAILAVFVVLVYYVIFLLRPLVSLDRRSRQLWLMVVIVLSLGLVGAYVGEGSLKSDFSELGGEKFTVENVVSGKAINRGPLTMFALKRIRKNSWIIGNGFGTPRGNLWAWIGKDPEKLEKKIAGFHNLYLSLPMLYGWLGMLCFLLLIFYTDFRLIFVVLKYRRKNSFLVVLALGLALFWLIFLVDEYKISILRNPNYHMIFWIWLGLSNAVVETLRMAKTDS
ncbi:MAG: O-antigen ligase family protein [Clostridiales bacterium]|nr:O-antigen ligase family protein [Clostridiales bacterium]